MIDMSMEQLRVVLDLAPEFEFMKFDTLAVSNDLVSKVQQHVKDNKFTSLSDIPEILNIFE